MSGSAKSRKSYEPRRGLAPWAIMGRGHLPVGVLLLAALLSGCLSTSVPLVVFDGVSQAKLSLGPNATRGIDPVFWSSTLTGDEARQGLVLEVPTDYLRAYPASLEVSVKIPDTLGSSVGLALNDSTGHQVAEAKWAVAARVILVNDPRPGTYEIIVAREGDSSQAIPFVVVAQLEPRVHASGPARDLLPDLVGLVPTRLQVPAGDGYRGDGCKTDEYVEHDARRCLRLDGRVGNVGEGALDVTLSAADGVVSGVLNNVIYPVLDGHWVQTIQRSDGSKRQENVGAAQFHPWHEHFHYQGLAHYQIYAYDLANHERGAPVKEGTKAGFCFEDMGLLELGRLGTVPPAYDGYNCGHPLTQPEKTWGMGLSPGWFDSYVWSLSDQYVEITGVPDGVYELVSRVNSAGTLIESKLDNNEASVVFRLTGNNVEILEPHGIAP